MAETEPTSASEIGAHLQAIDSRVRALVAELLRAGCLERSRIVVETPRGRRAVWHNRATDEPLPTYVPTENEVQRQRYRRELLAVLDRSASVTVIEAASELDCSKKRARQHLEALEADGIVQRTGAYPAAWTLAGQAHRLAS